MSALLSSSLSWIKKKSQLLKLYHTEQTQTITQTFQKRSVLTKEVVRLIVYATTFKFQKKCPFQHPALTAPASCSQVTFSYKPVAREHAGLCQPTGSSLVRLHTASYDLMADRNARCLCVSSLILVKLLSSLKHLLITSYTLINDL